LVIPVYCWPDNEGLVSEVNVPEGKIDFVTSFGGIHHINKDRYDLAFQNMAKMLKPGGRVRAADVPGNSALQHHFDEVVDKKSLTRHPMGRFMTPELLAEYSHQAGLEFDGSEVKPLTWDFNSTKEMAYFFKGLHAYDLPDEEIVRDLKDTLGFEEKDGKIKHSWPMLFFEITKKD
jgi:SAM-dependent methyltransferase